VVERVKILSDYSHKPGLLEYSQKYTLFGDVVSCCCPREPNSVCPGVVGGSGGGGNRRGGGTHLSVSNQVERDAFQFEGIECEPNVHWSTKTVLFHGSFQFARELIRSVKLFLRQEWTQHAVQRINSLQRKKK